MQKAEHILQAIRKMGEKHIPLTRVYRCLYSEDLFLAAYVKIARNKGALTPGTENDTADGMSLKRIHNIIEQLRYERFKFRPVRRTRVPKKSGGTRPLGIPDFSEKLVQEAVRLMLEAYYEPRFKDSSHGFRPGRGCHTALARIHEKFKGTTWFIEGDIRGCFDEIDHSVLEEILSRDIHDGRLLNLIRMCLKAGYVEDWTYHRTYSGAPQGGVLSPILSNIYLHELDVYVEDVLIPRYTRGKRRSPNLEYQRLCYRLRQEREKQGNSDTIRELEQQIRQLPSQDTQDPKYRRLKYVRYCDDFLLGLIGPRFEAEAAKAAVGTFLDEKLHLRMSEHKTLITHARTENALFLGYAVSVYHVNSKISRRTGTLIKTRGINGNIRLGVPYGRIDEYAKRYQRGGKPIHETELMAHSDAHIINAFQLRFRGLAEYYKHAVDRCHLGKLKYVMEIALTKTLAMKYKASTPTIYRRYHGTRTVDDYTYKTLQVEVPTKKGTRCIYWGAVPLRVVKPGLGTINDVIKPYLRVPNTRTDLIQRLQAQECQLCGSQEDCEVHHIRKLSDLKQRWKGRTEKPPWVENMIALQRKTLVVCHQCHVDIHAGRPTPKRRN
jgi:group II intron reverse transcriptase/maturase